MHLMAKTNQNVRMTDVAKLAKVAPITVSRALLTPEKVDPATRARIEKAIAKTGYVRNRVAGGLASNRTHIIAAVVPTIDNPVYGSTLQGLSDVLHARQFHLMVANSGVDPKGEEELVGMLLSYRPDGMFFHNVEHTDKTRRLLKGAGIPVVEAGDLPRDPVDMVVSYSNFTSAKAMTMHLGRKGYRRIGFVCNDVRTNPRARERRRGYVEALRELRLKSDPDLIEQMPLGFQEGAAALDILTKRCPDIDAIFFSAELWAAGALLECHRRGWKVPQRLAIVGYDDQRIAPTMTPALTAARVPRLEIGRRAGEMLLSRIAGEPLERNVVDLGYEISEGATA
jgi:LacI family gluconate utilization system Gnt-I transcriptional repressor